MRRQNARTLEERCPAHHIPKGHGRKLRDLMFKAYRNRRTFKAYGSRCTLRRGHPGPHLDPRDREWHAPPEGRDR